MQLPELLRTSRHLGLSGMAASLEARLVQAQADQLAPADFLVLLLQDELTRRADRLLARRLKDAQFRVSYRHALQLIRLFWLTA